MDCVVERQPERVTYRWGWAGAACVGGAVAMVDEAGAREESCTRPRSSSAGIAVAALTA